MTQYVMIWGDWGLPRLAGPFADADAAAHWGEAWEAAGGDLRWQVLQADPADVGKPMRIISPAATDQVHPE